MKIKKEECNIIEEKIKSCDFLEKMYFIFALTLNILCISICLIAIIKGKFISQEIKYIILLSVLVINLIKKSLYHDIMFKKIGIVLYINRQKVKTLEKNNRK